MIIRSRRKAVSTLVAQKQPEPQPIEKKEPAKKKIKKAFSETPIEEKAKKIIEEIEEEVLQEDKN